MRVSKNTASVEETEKGRNHRKYTHKPRFNSRPTNQTKDMTTDDTWNGHCSNLKRERHTHTERQTDTHRQTQTQTDRQTDRQIGRQTDRDRDRDRERDRQTET